MARPKQTEVDVLPFRTPFITLPKKSSDNILELNPTMENWEVEIPKESSRKDYVVEKVRVFGPLIDNPPAALKKHVSQLLHYVVLLSWFNSPVRNPNFGDSIREARDAAFGGSIVPEGLEFRDAIDLQLGTATRKCWDNFLEYQAHYAYSGFLRMSLLTRKYMEHAELAIDMVKEDGNPKYPLKDCTGMYETLMDKFPQLETMQRSVFASRVIKTSTLEMLETYLNSSISQLQAKSAAQKANKDSLDGTL